MAANGGNTGGGGGERARGYAKETFEKWAHPFADAISTNDFVRDYHYFIPITAFRRGAIGFRDLTQAPSMMKSATGYCTVLQFLGELMRFLPTKGTVTQEHSATYTFKRGNGELVTLPKVRFLVQCVVRDTHKLGLALDLLPEHELLNPHNHLGIMISLLFHDPNLELIDLIEALVSESASKQPQERRAYLMDEIRNAELLDEQQRQESDGEASDGEEGDDAGPGRASDKTEAAAAADGGAAAARGKRPRAKGKGARGEKKRPRRGARQSIMQPQRKDPIEDYITYKKIDQLKSAIILLLDVATGNSEVSNKLRYITRAQLIDAIRNRTDPIVNLEYKLGFDATLSRIREFATKHLPGPEPSSEQLFSNYYIKKVSVPWEPWMDEEEKEEDADDEEKSKDAGGQPTAQQSPEPPPKRRRLTDADADADTAEKQPSREKEIADAEMAEAILPEQCDPQQQQQPQNLAAQRKMVERDIFRMPVPKLAWELMPHQTAAKRLMRVTFPWKRADSGMIFAGIAARYLRVGIGEILGTAKMSGSGGASAAPPNDAMSNAGYIASLLDLHQPGSTDQDSGGVGDSLETEEDWSPYPTLGVNVVVSKLRPLGRKANAVKGFVRTYVTRKVSEILAKVTELEKGSGRGRKDGGADTPPATPPLPPPESQSPDGMPSGDYERLGELLDDGSNDARRDCGPDLAGDLAGIVALGRRGGGDEDDADDAEIRKLKSEIKDMRGRGFMAIAEIEKAALVEMVTLLETSACVPDAVKACAMWINRHEDDMALDFDVHCKDMGPFGQLITSMMAMYKDYGVPTNQWPVMVFTIGRDVGYIAHIIGRLAMHIKVMGKFAGGKSHALETMANLSVKGTTCSVTGSSTQGMLPIYAEEGKPEGDMTALYDELPPLWTMALRRMSVNDQKAARMMTSLMTKGMVLYATNVKGADNKIHSEKRIVEANIPIMGATNEGRSGAAPEARMVTVYMQNNVPGPRNAINAMCNADTASGRDAPGRAAIELTLRKLHSLVFMVCKSVEAGSMPVPENERFCRYMEATIEYITLHYPDLAEKVRMVDVAHSMATVLSIWTAVLLAYAPGFAKVSEGGAGDGGSAALAALREKIHSCELDGVQFDILKLRDKVLKHLRIDEDVTFFVIAYMIFNSCQPEGYKILRGVTEMHGHYPFVSFCRKSLQAQEDDEEEGAEEIVVGEEEGEGGGEAEKSKEKKTSDDDADGADSALQPQPQQQQQQPAAPASAIKMTLEELEAELSTYQCRGLNVPAGATRIGMGSGSGKGGRRSGGGGSGARGSARLAGPRSRLMGSARDSRAHDDGGEPTIEQMALAEYEEIEGETVLLPPNGRLGRKKKLEFLAASILKGTELPPYIYKPEKARPPKMDDYVPFYNPNYVLVQGKLENFAETFVAANPGLKMTALQVCGELECMRTKYVMAHQLPWVPTTRVRLSSARKFLQNF